MELSQVVTKDLADSKERMEITNLVSTINIAGKRVDTKLLEEIQHKVTEQ